jgi:hypothetical protein
MPGESDAGKVMDEMNIYGVLCLLPNQKLIQLQFKMNLDEKLARRQTSLQIYLCHKIAHCAPHPLSEYLMRSLGSMSWLFKR